MAPHCIGLKRLSLNMKEPPSRRDRGRPVRHLTKRLCTEQSDITLRKGGPHTHKAVAIDGHIRRAAQRRSPSPRSNSNTTPRSFGSGTTGTTARTSFLGARTTTFFLRGGRGGRRGIHCHLCNPVSHASPWPITFTPSSSAQSRRHPLMASALEKRHRRHQYARSEVTASCDIVIAMRGRRTASLSLQ